MRYLLITHIPFATKPDGSVLIDRLWAEDLGGLVGANGPVTIAAPEVAHSSLKSWGPDLTSLPPHGPITFSSLPTPRGRLDLSHRFRVRRALRAAVDAADLVHTSNLYDPWTALYFGHDYATSRGKKTVFVVAEDFYDMFEWEWVRLARPGFSRWWRQRIMHRLDRNIKRRVASASLTFLHTPASVARYRSFTMNGVAIRQPVHEANDIIGEAALQERLASLHLGAPLNIVTASRFKPLKGLDLLIHAVSVLEKRGIAVDLKMYGEGPQQPDLRALVTRLGLTHRIAFPGPLAPAATLRAALARGDFFVMPHLTSDFGRGFFDAITGGLPVIAFRSIASQDTVREEIDGLLVPNADAEALAAAIARFHHDRDFLARVSVAARTRAVENTKTFWNEFRAGMIRDLCRIDVQPSPGVAPLAQVGLGAHSDWGFARSAKPQSLIAHGLPHVTDFHPGARAAVPGPVPARKP